MEDVTDPRPGRSAWAPSSLHQEIRRLVYDAITQAFTEAKVERPAPMPVAAPSTAGFEEVLAGGVEGRPAWEAAADASAAALAELDPAEKRLPDDLVEEGRRLLSDSLGVAEAAYVAARRLDALWARVSYERPHDYSTEPSVDDAMLEVWSIRSHAEAAATVLAAAGRWLEDSAGELGEVPLEPSWLRLHYSDRIR